MPAWGLMTPRQFEKPADALAIGSADALNLLRGDFTIAAWVMGDALAGQPGLFRLEGRGYCTQPARAVGGDGAVLLSRFDVVALVPAAP